MKREVIITKDGSSSISIPEMGVTYHSIHGAIQESQHVFINNGLLYAFECFPHQSLNILEIGFGTGLNALLSFYAAEKTGNYLHYTAIDLHPLDIETALTLNYVSQLNMSSNLFFENLHSCEWEKECNVSGSFLLFKRKVSLADYEPERLFHLIYFDAFAPNAQPDLWTIDVFKKLSNCMHTNGILVTYCAKGEVRRAMQAAGLRVEKLPGPVGKREMIRAIRKPTID